MLLVMLAVTLKQAQQQHSQVHRLLLRCLRMVQLMYG
jgi:type II secretory pathway component PulJ